MVEVTADKKQLIIKRGMKKQLEKGRSKWNSIFRRKDHQVNAKSLDLFSGKKGSKRSRVFSFKIFSFPKETKLLHMLEKN